MFDVSWIIQCNITNTKGQLDLSVRGVCVRIVSHVSLHNRHYFFAFSGEPRQAQSECYARLASDKNCILKEQNNSPVCDTGSDRPMVLQKLLFFFFGAGIVHCLFCLVPYWYLISQVFNFMFFTFVKKSLDN